MKKSKSSSSYLCNYNHEYSKEFPWSEADPENKTNAKCKLCDKTFTLSNMGRTALVSHAAGKKHKKKIVKKQTTLTSNFFTQSDSSKKIVDTTSAENSEIRNDEKNCTQKVIESTSESTTSTSVEVSKKNANHEAECCCACHITSTSGEKKMQSYFTNNEVTTAETLWIMHNVLRHNSLRDTESSVPVLSRMFSDSEIAKKLKLRKDKVAYTVTYGLKKYFEDELINLASSSDYIVGAFDESLNEVTKKQQMDIVIRFWNNTSNEVNTRYLTSTFLGRTRAIDLLNAFQDSIPKLIFDKLLQISMDGPYVNLKFLKDLQESILLELDKKLIDIGTCSLHIVHNAFKASIKAAKWEIVEVLRALFNLFHNVPARRAVYKEASGADLFPLSFCGIRWLENAGVAERAQEIIPHVSKYVEKVTKDKTEPTCNSYKIVKNALLDKLLPSKLAFFQSFARSIEPFLKEFQTNDPKVPFLYDSLSTLYVDTLERFVKPEILTQHGENVLKIDLKKSENLLTAQKVKIGYATKEALKQVKEGLDVLTFKNECRTIMKEFVILISEKSPLKYSLVKGLSCFNPSNTLKKQVAEKRLSTVLQKFVSNNIIPAIKAEKVDREFKKIIAFESTQEKLKSYKKDETRLDHLWISILKLHGIENYPNLLFLIKIVMMLSHGNAALERGFSINKECLVENQSERSLVAQRLIFDAISATNSPLEEFNVSKKLLQYVRNSHSWYKESLAEEKKTREKEEETKRNNKRKQTAVQELEMKKKKVMDDALQESANLEKEIQNLKQS